MNEIENKKIITFFVLSERAGPYMDLGREQEETDLTRSRPRMNFAIFRLN